MDWRKLIRRTISSHKNRGSVAPNPIDPIAPIHPSTRHLFVEGKPGHFFLCSLYGALPKSQLLSIPYPLWHNFDPGLAYLQRSLKPTVQTVTFVTLQPLIYGPSRPALIKLMQSTEVSFFGILHRLPQNAEQEDALREVAPYISSLFVLAEPLVDILFRDYGITSVSYLPPNASLSNFVRTNRDTTRKRIGASDRQTVFSILGQLRPGKGFDLLLKAVERLSNTELRDLFFLIAGRPEESNAELISRELSSRGASYYLDLRASGNPYKYDVLSDKEFGEYISASDFGLFLYDQSQKLCMSGVAPNFVSAEKPLIASTDSVVGRVVADHDLGLVVDAHSPSAVAKILREAKVTFRNWSPSSAYIRYKQSLQDNAVLEVLSKALNS